MQVEIEYLGIPFTIEGLYTPGEPEEMYDGTGGGYPGSPSEFEIKKITILDSDVDIWELLSDKQLIEITELVIEKTEE